jgi:hypothetical protein
MTRVEQRFGSVRIVAEGDDCEINNRAFGMNLKGSTFRLADVRTVMVSSHKNWLGTREWFLHLLGHDGEIVKFEVSYRSEAYAAATFIRHLIREWGRSEREILLESKQSERERVLEARRLERQRLQEAKHHEHETLLEANRSERERTGSHRTEIQPSITTRSETAVSEVLPTEPQRRSPSESQGSRGVRLKAQMKKLEGDPDRIKVTDRRRRAEPAASDVTSIESQRQRDARLTESEMEKSERDPDQIKVTDRRRRD